MAVSDAYKLRLYNAALRLLRETGLASLTENRESRYALDGVWDDGGGAVKSCLETGIWHFAKRTVSLSFAPSITPSFGLRYAFTHPDDYVRLVDMCQDEYLNTPLTQYRENAGLWFADIDPIYVSYVSKDDAYGLDTSLWPESFRMVVEAYLATKIAPSIADSQIERADAALKKALMEAKSLGAMSQPTRFSPISSWERARLSRSAGWDRGVRNRLIG